MNHIYTCKEVCNQDKHCGNIHCSANLKFIPVKKKSEKPRKEKPLIRV